MGKRGDEAKPPAGLADFDVAGGAAGSIVEVLERVALGKACPHHGERQVLIEPAFAHVPERHDFDEREVHAAAVRPFHQLRELVLVDALERDRIDLDPQACRLCGVDARQNLVELAPTRDGAEFIGIERVE